jgi:hypothetical protein
MLVSTAVSVGRTFSTISVAIEAKPNGVPPPISASPIASTHFGPIRVTSACAAAATTTTVPAVATKVTPAFSAE